MSPTPIHTATSRALAEPPLRPIDVRRHSLANRLPGDIVKKHVADRTAGQRPVKDKAQRRDNLRQLLVHPFAADQQNTKRPASRQTGVACQHNATLRPCAPDDVTVGNIIGILGIVAQ
jgi:hypothetical protein